MLAPYSKSTMMNLPKLDFNIWQRHSKYQLYIYCAIFLLKFSLNKISTLTKRRRRRGIFDTILTIYWIMTYATSSKWSVKMLYVFVSLCCQNCVWVWHALIWGCLVLKQFKMQSQRHAYNLGPLHTWDWTPMTIAFYNLSLVEKAKSVQVHFTLEGECLRIQRNYHGQKFTWVPIWHIIIMFMIC